MVKIIQKSTERLKEKLIRSQKQIGVELGEVSRHAQSQISGASEAHPIPRSEERESPITEAMRQVSQPEPTDEEKERLARQHIARSGRLEEELKMATRQRFEKEKLASEIRDPQQVSNEEITKPGDPMLPTSPTSRRKAHTPGKQQKGPEFGKGLNQ